MSAAERVEERTSKTGPFSFLACFKGFFLPPSEAWLRVRQSGYRPYRACWSTVINE